MFKKVKYFIARQIIHLLNSYNERSCYANSIACSGSFVDGAKVFNFQNNPSSIKIQKNTLIRGELLAFAHGGKISIGENIDIGNNVLISYKVNIIDSNSHELNYLEQANGYSHLITSGHSNQKGSVITKEIKIEDYAWINFNSSILKGVTIGQGSIVVANSVVLNDVPPFVLVGGTPAKIIKKL